jgi:hypothetical protein
MDNSSRNHQYGQTDVSLAAQRGFTQWALIGLDNSGQPKIVTSETDQRSVGKLIQRVSPELTQQFEGANT